MKLAIAIVVVAVAVPARADDCQTYVDKTSFTLAAFAATDPTLDAKMITKYMLETCRKSRTVEEAALMRCVLAAPDRPAVERCTLALEIAFRTDDDAEGEVLLDHLDIAVEIAHARTKQFPVAKLAATPAKACCSQPLQLCEGTAWGKPWEALGVSWRDPHHFQLAYESDGKTFTATAVGDPRCVGKSTTLTLTGSIDGGKVLVKRSWEPPNRKPANAPPAARNSRGSLPTTPMRGPFASAEEPCSKLPHCKLQEVPHLLLRPPYAAVSFLVVTDDKDVPRRGHLAVRIGKEWWVIDDVAFDRSNTPVPNGLYLQDELDLQEVFAKDRIPGGMPELSVSMFHRETKYAHNNGTAEYAKGLETMRICTITAGKPGCRDVPVVGIYKDWTGETPKTDVHVKAQLTFAMDDVMISYPSDADLKRVPGMLAPGVYSLK